MLEEIKSQLPEWAKDVRLNLSKVLELSHPDALSHAQINGAALAVAYHLNDRPLIEALKEIAEDDQVDSAAKLAASLMAMTNIYYRYVHLSDHAELGLQPAGLRKQGMVNPGIDKITFEILSLAVSILNGCGACISSHTRQLTEHGLSAQALARVGRIAAVIHATHVTKNLSD